MAKEDVAKILLEIKAVKLSPDEPFRYTSGILSPIYCDNRLLMSYPEQRKIITDLFISMIEGNGLEFDVVAGTASSAIPWAAWISERLGKPMIYIRKASKDYGMAKRVEGELRKGQRVLLVEDLISTGGSSLSAIEGVREAGGVVDSCVAIFTYGMKKATDGFETAKCKLLTLSDFGTLMEVAKESGHITEDQYAKAIEWNKCPESWGR